MSSPFQAPPAGTDVPPSSDARYFYRRQVYSRNPVTDSNFVGGRTVNFQAEASGGHYLVPSECRIVAKLLVTNSAGGQLEKSVRFATDPIHTGMFSAGMLSINGTTVESVASNMRDVALLQLRMDNTSAGADMGGGTAGLLGFSQKMVQSEEHLSPADLAAVKAQNGGSAGGANADSSAATAGAGGWNAATALQAAVPTDERSDKHELLLNNCSNKRRADGRVFSANAVAGGAGYAGAAATSVAPSPIEISAPMSQGFAFMRQKRALANAHAPSQAAKASSYRRAQPAGRMVRVQR
jgi:hypothetical protein